MAQPDPQAAGGSGEDRSSSVRAAASPKPPPFNSDTDPDAATTALAELVAIVDRLRNPEGGCPWDLEQTHNSLIPYVLEEAHEVADAIRRGDPEDLQDELGDLLLQVVLHARIASEAGQFDLAAITRGISAKLVRRHPHVFAGAEAADSAAVRRSWEAIKAEERAQRRLRGAVSSETITGEANARPTTRTHSNDDARAGARTETANERGNDSVNDTIKIDENSLIDDVRLLNDYSQVDNKNSSDEATPPRGPLSDRLASKVRGQPALAAAMTISRQAAAAGFEWDDLDGVWAKVHEELDELKEAVALAWSESGIQTGSPGRAPTSGDSAAQAHAETELGDVLFTLVNVARWCRLDPEEGLAGTNRRFLDRFSRLEAALGGDLGGRSIQELETHWQQAKAAIRAEQAQRAEP